MKYLAIAFIASIALTACGKGDAPSSNGSPALSQVGLSGTYKSSSGNTTLKFSSGKLRIEAKFVDSVEYSYSFDGNKVKWVYEASGVNESCEIKSGTAIYCSSAAETYTKID